MIFTGGANKIVIVLKGKSNVDIILISWIHICVFPLGRKWNVAFRLQMLRNKIGRKRNVAIIRSQAGT